MYGVLSIVDMISYIIFGIPIVLLTAFVSAFTVAAVVDYLQARRDRNDLFKILQREHKPKRPAAK